MGASSPDMKRISRPNSSTGSFLYARKTPPSGTGEHELPLNYCSIALVLLVRKQTDFRSQDFSAQDKKGVLLAYTASSAGSASRCADTDLASGGETVKLWGERPSAYTSKQMEC